MVRWLNLRLLEGLDLKQTFRIHRRVVSRWGIALEPRENPRQPFVADAVPQCFTGLFVGDDDDRHHAVGSILRRDLQCPLAGTGMGRQHDAIGDAGARRLRAIVVRDGDLARTRFKLFHRIETDADTDRNERAERTMYPSAERDPFILGFGVSAGRKKESEDYKDMTNAFHRHTVPAVLKSASPNLGRR
jgi:hypothetical protein